MSISEKILQKLKESGLDDTKATRLLSDIIQIIDEEKKKTSDGGGSNPSSSSFGSSFTSYTKRLDI
ncbi:MAG: hypothetical protein M3Y85_09030 [Bacteroidota bacterium]|nr:hypothetical protein [Bacteroidota bacterium]